MKFFPWMLSVLLAACSLHSQNVAPDAPHASGRAGTVSSGPAPVVPPRPIAPKQIREAENELFFRFKWADREFVIGEGVWKEPKYDANWNNMYGWGPVAWVKAGGHTRVLDLRAELVSHYVAAVFQDERTGKIVAFLDFGIEGPARAYKVWISEDRGEHWFPGADLPRPPGRFPPAVLDSFFLDAKGQGVAWFHAEAGDGPEGVYRAITHDGARTWTVENEPLFSSVLHKVQGEWK